MGGWQLPDAATLATWIGLWWWPFVRLSAAFWAMPLLGDFTVNVRVRIILAFLLALLVAPLHQVPLPAVDPLSPETALLTLAQILFGALFGSGVRCLFWLLGLTGQVISQQMGLAMAVMNDPVNGQSTPVMASLLNILCGLLFLTMNGHLVVLDLLVNSLRLWPPGSSIYLLGLDQVWRLVAWFFTGAMTLALPAVIAMLLVNLAFGVMNRTAPAFNILSLGFPLSMIVGLFAFLLTFSGIPGVYLELVEGMLSHLAQFTGGR
ncbi:flagellar biosynthetic protein FliR [Aeromonas sp. RU39B]|uniref:flagellar biosynthetic protein FliR n=1 Tax=Aeromonas sp. RU39B TaxID=1907416 RepID=UPI0009567FA2|nr:flagellar biosynthetic protein FliR [Aeromonas sp. RU39B]SIR16189.1 flagellar biosynthetic protein FliR [Aeromonas sp. RU39B]